jgi:hypothetical protein
MKLTDFLFRVVTAHNTSLGDNDAFPPREDVAFDYHVLKKRFDEVIGNMESEFGYLPSPDEALSLLSEYVTLAQRKEEPIKNQLETLAFNIVNEALCTPKETVILRTSLVNRVEPLNDIRVMPEDDEASNDGYSFEDIDEVILTNKAVMKRRLINSLVQGASYRLMLKYLDDDQIYEWDEDLVDIYYKIVYLNDYLLFVKKEKISDKHPMLGSYVDTDLGEGEKKTEIYAQALVYPLLLQETFRGFFELFGSYGLPDDKKKANIILHKADFLVAEAWDLRMGVGLWDIVSDCTSIGEDSYLPYVFTSIVALQGVEFNKMMQNIFCHTKTAQNFILGVIKDVKHDQDYNVFKQDIQTANLKKCLINDEDSKEEEEAINESGMRSWKYWNEIRDIANRIIKDKAKILKAENFKSYDLIIDGKDYPVYVANRQVFLSYNPEYTSVAGFFNGACIELWIDRDTQLKQILSILSHEIEHVIDSENSPEFDNYKQTDLQGKAYNYVEIPDFVKNGDENALYLFKTIREILYHLWIKTETNAFIANAMKEGQIFFDRIEYDIKAVNDTNANDYPEIWDYFSNVLARKNKICYDIDEITPQLIKKHFVSQSYHKLKKLKETYQRKKGYAKMNGIDINSEFDDNVCYLMFPNEYSTQEYGPYSFNDVIEAYKKSELPETTTCRKKGEKGHYPLNDWINGIDNEEREFWEDEPIVKESRELVTEGISDKTYHYCSLPTLYKILSSGQLKLTMSANKSDAYHKTKLFYLSTQRSKNNRLGYARNREVRIELDGYKLKSHGYQGRPLDYWGGLMGKQSEIGIDAFKKKYGNKNDDYSDEQRRNITNSQAHTSNFEFEDRIFSNKPSLSLDYVSRIDCLVEELEPIDKDILNMAQKLGVNIAFYNSEKDFILQTNNVINDEVSRIEGEYDDRWDKYDDSQKSRTYPELITKLCALLFYYKFYNNHNSNPQVVNDAISNVLNKFDLSEYTEHVINELPHVIMWIIRDIPYLETALRKLNTDSFTNAKKSENIMLLAQYVLNHYKVSSFVGLNIYFEKHPWQKDRPVNVKIVEQVPCIALTWGGEEPRIYKGDRLFWGYEFPWSDEQMFYSEIEQIVERNQWDKDNGYDDVEDVKIHHNSKDNTSFLKYIQHLMHNKNLTAFEGVTILSKIMSEGDMVKTFGYSVKPIMIDKDKMIELENNINWDDKKLMIPALFGDENSYYQYMFRDKN